MRVLLVEDSLVARELLQAAIGGDSRLRVAHVVASGEAALDALERVRPDVISMDVVLPGLSGIETTRRIMALHPTPIVMVSAAVGGESGLALEAMHAGALGVAEKPAGPGDVRSLTRIRDLLVTMSSVRLVRQRRQRAAAATRSSFPTPAPTSVGRSGDGVRFLGLAASTGGPPAIAKVLRGLGADHGMPVFVVQHIAPAFLGGFADWLGRQIAMPVVMAAAGCEPQPGVVYLAPGDRHLALAGRRVALHDGPPECGHRPSANVLFRSLASVGGSALGVLLTGMGDDGAEGLLALRQAGGHTIAEDRSTAVVHGMPGVAERIGAACEMLRLPAIAARILELGSRRE